MTRFTLTPLAPCPDVLLIDNAAPFRDNRGVFAELYRERMFAEEAGIPPFVQGNASWSVPWTLRGMHYQLRWPQGKFVRVFQGAIFDVAVDLRQRSSTFGQWVGKYLDSTTHQGLYIPPGFAHGFLALSSGAMVLYECTTEHDPSSDRALSWRDPELNIAWPLGANTPMNISPKDRAARLLADIPADELFP